MQPSLPGLLVPPASSPALPPLGSGRGSGSLCATLGTPPAPLLLLCRLPLWLLCCLRLIWLLPRLQQHPGVLQLLICQAQQAAQLRLPVTVGQQGGSWGWAAGAWLSAASRMCQSKPWHTKANTPKPSTAHLSTCCKSTTRSSRRPARRCGGAVDRLARTLQGQGWGLRMRGAASGVVCGALGKTLPQISTNPNHTQSPPCAHRT